MVENIFLGFEMQIKGALGQACLGDDIRNPGVLEAVVVKYIDGGGHQLPSGPFPSVVHFHLQSLKSMPFFMTEASFINTSDWPVKLEIDPYFSFS
jgi:hypothetical protein